MAETLKFMFLDTWWFWVIIVAAAMFLIFTERTAFFTAAKRTDTEPFNFSLMMVLLAGMCLIISVVYVQGLSSDLSQLDHLPKSPPSTTPDNNPWGPPLIDGRQVWSGSVLMLLNIIRGLGLGGIIVFFFGVAVLVHFVNGYSAGHAARSKTKSPKKKQPTQEVLETQPDPPTQVVTPERRDSHEVQAADAPKTKNTKETQTTRPKTKNRKTQEALETQLEPPTQVVIPESQVIKSHESLESVEVLESRESQEDKVLLESLESLKNRKSNEAKVFVAPEGREPANLPMTSLIPDEHIIYKAKTHWIILTIPAALTFCCLCHTLLYALGISEMRGQPQEMVVERQLLLCFTIILFFLFVALISTTLSYMTSDVTLTNKRVVIRSGFIYRVTQEMLLTHIESIDIGQTLLGRFFGYGTILIIGSGGTQKSFTRVAGVAKLKEKIQLQISQRPKDER